LSNKTRENLLKATASEPPQRDALRGLPLFDGKGLPSHPFSGADGWLGIEDVLPVLVPELSYADLAIRESGMTSQMWGKITSAEMNAAEKK
jgi:hypothetical protein